MKEIGFALSDGYIYKRAPDAMYTYVFYSTVKDYILSIMSNGEITNGMLPYYRDISNVLSEPACRLIEPIVIDYNFIEVESLGTCFDIENKCIVHLPQNLLGSPREYVKYEYKADTLPNPTKLIEGKIHPTGIRRDINVGTTSNLHHHANSRCFDVGYYVVC